ncbi:MAG: nucleoid occlusion factor SlmA, partial [Lacisediminimonas sp.]|nr:nucleoid occlusion factor SlmA [Lacisediminimonas sp.]
ERIELALRQSLKLAASQGQASEAEAADRAGMITSLVLGRWHRFAKTGFRQRPTEGGPTQIALLLV